MYFTSSFVFRHCTIDNLKWFGKGVLIDFALSMLNLSNTFSTWLHWYNHNLLVVLSLWISTQESSQQYPNPSCQILNSIKSSTCWLYSYSLQQSICHPHKAIDKWKNYHQGSLHKHNSHTHIFCSRSWSCRSQIIYIITLEIVSVHKVISQLIDQIFISRLTKPF